MCSQFCAAGAVWTPSPDIDTAPAILCPIILVANQQVAKLRDPWIRLRVLFDQLPKLGNGTPAVKDPGEGSTRRNCQFSHPRSLSAVPVLWQSIA
jgi:hypothetical protein